MSLRLAFMGTPEFAAVTLQHLINAGHEIACVYTRAPKPAGRGKHDQKTAVHALAEQLGLQVRHPKSLRENKAQTDFAALAVDLAVVVAYGLILPKEILQAPGHGCFNLHGSLLPRWRGAAPIQRAIMAGDSMSGVQVMQMDEGLDTGDILLSANLPVAPDETAASLHDRMKITGAELMVEALGKLEHGLLHGIPQSNQGITYAHKIDKKEARINWSGDAHELDFQIRGLSPFPGAWFIWPDKKGEKRIKVLMSEFVELEGAPGELLDTQMTIACGQGAIRLHQVQLAGSNAQSGEEFIRGHRLVPKVIFS